MKIPTLFAASLALVIMAVPFESQGKDPDFKPPGTEETPQWTRPTQNWMLSINA